MQRDSTYTWLWRAAGPVRRLIMLAALWLGLAVPTALGQQPQEQILAGYMFNFIHYTQWPPTSFNRADDPIIVSVADELIMARLLAGIASGKQVHGRSIVVRHVVPIDLNDDGQIDAAELGVFYRRLQQSHAVFLGRSYEALTDSVLSHLANRNTLTVGFVPGFAQRGGLLGLRVHESRIVFDANLDAIERTQLQISSKLLRLANIVRDSD